MSRKNTHISKIKKSKKVLESEKNNLDTYHGIIFKSRKVNLDKFF